MARSQARRYGLSNQRLTTEATAESTSDFTGTQFWSIPIHFSTSVMFISMDQLPPALQDDLQLHGMWQPVLGAPQTPSGDQLRYLRCSPRTCQPLRQLLQFLRCTVELQRHRQEQSWICIDQFSREDDMP